MSHSSAPSFIAGGNIGPSLFVKIEAGESNTVILCGAGDAAIGISQEGTREAPIPGVTPLAAAEGESLLVYQLGEPCEIVAAAAIAAGDYLKPNASGQAVVAGAGDAYSAVSLVDCASGEKCKVVIREGRIPAA